jgi:hypothetical protein
MMYVLALILPPVPLFMIGKMFQAIFNLILFVLSIVIFIVSFSFASFISFPLWLIAVVHALIVVHNHRTDTRMREIARDAAAGQDRR